MPEVSNTAFYVSRLGSRRGVQLFDRLGIYSHQNSPRRRFNLAAVQFAHIKIVNCRAAFVTMRAPSHPRRISRTSAKSRKGGRDGLRFRFHERAVSEDSLSNMDCVGIRSPHTADKAAGRDLFFDGAVKSMSRPVKTFSINASNFHAARARKIAPCWRQRQKIHPARCPSARVKICAPQDVQSVRAQCARDLLNNPARSHVQIFTRCNRGRLHRSTR